MSILLITPLCRRGGHTTVTVTKPSSTHHRALVRLFPWWGRTTPPSGAPLRAESLRSDLLLLKPLILLLLLLLVLSYETWHRSVLPAAAALPRHNSRAFVPLLRHRRMLSRRSGVGRFASARDASAGSTPVDTLEPSLSRFLAFCAFCAFCAFSVPRFLGSLGEYAGAGAGALRAGPRSLASLRRLGRALAPRPPLAARPGRLQCFVSSTALRWTLPASRPPRAPAPRPPAIPSPALPCSGRYPRAPALRSPAPVGRSCTLCVWTFIGHRCLSVQDHAYMWLPPIAYPSPVSFSTMR